MSESASNTVLTGPGQGVISDGFGTQWTISETGTVLAGGAPDADATPVEQIAFVQGFVWRQRATDLMWSCKRHASDAWSTPTTVSPLGGPVDTNTAVVSNVTTGNTQVLAAIAALQQDFDDWKATQPPSPTPSQLADEITALRQDVDTRGDDLAGQINNVANICNQIAMGLGVEDDETQEGFVKLSGLLNEVLAGQAATDALAAGNQQAVTTQLNAVQAAMVADQTALVASLSQLVDAATGPTGLATLQRQIATLQTDFTNLTVTLNAIAIGISEKLQQILLLDDPTANATLLSEIKTILADVQQILAIVQAQEPKPPTQLVADLGDATHTPQAIPPRG